MNAVDILQPVLVVALLSLVMFLWMVATRLPAMTRSGIDPQAAADTSALKGLLPAEVNRISDNYNHLFEAPTVFYAVALVIAVLGHVDPTHVACAWAYAGLRVVHSGVQATTNHVMTRFTLFALSWLALALMILRELLAVF